MKPSSPLRKAAVLIHALDGRSADALLDQMGEGAAQRVRAAVMELGDVSAAEQEQVIAEFLGRDESAAHQNVDEGIELSGSLAALTTRQALSPRDPSPQRVARNNGPHAAPFAFLQETSAETVARYLLREHPQTIAVVLAHVPPARAAKILEQFPAEIQADVLERIGDIDDMDPESVRDVERGLEAVLAHELRTSRRPGTGAATVAAILNASRSARPQLLQAADKSNSHVPLPGAPASAGPAVPRRREEAAAKQPEPRAVPLPSTPEPQRTRVGGPTVEFAQLAQLSDRDWARILGAAETRVALLALAGATPELVERLLRQLPAADARVLQRKMEQLGPLRLRDIERAQEYLARIATQLAGRGEIRLPRPRPFATAA